MDKKTGIRLLLLVLAFVLCPRDCFAMQLLTKEQALKEMLPEADKTITETKVLSDAKIGKIKERLGGSLFHYQKGSKSEEIQEKQEKKEYSFYFGVKEGKKIGVAFVEVQPGKWGPVELIVALDPAEGKVKNLAVMSYTEKRGRPIARRNFLKQFVGKGSEDRILVRKDIRGISGATISSDCAAFAVRKVIVLYEEVFLKKEGED